MQRCKLNRQTWQLRAFQQQIFPWKNLQIFSPKPATTFLLSFNSETAANKQNT